MTMSDTGWRLFLTGLQHKDETLMQMGMERMATYLRNRHQEIFQ